jgi:NAD(P)-dependent dehydrogenase (short-subunit alcohol dehydrogenase family)
MNEREQKGLIAITGGTRGIGAAIAALAAECGYAVAVSYANDDAAASRLIEQLSLKTAAWAIKADMGEAEGAGRLFRALDEIGLPLAALINNAGVTGGFSRVDELTNSTLQRVFEVNVFGCFLCAREAVCRMSTRHGGHGGNIVNISSRAADLGGGGEWVHYAASKGALNTLTIGLAREVASESIRVNAVAAGLIDTGLHAAAGVPDRLERLAPQTPLQRGGTAKEVAEAVMWLISPAASYVTGAILPVAGGR